MAIEDSTHGQAVMWRLYALVGGADTVPGGPTKGEPVWMVRALKALAAAVGQVDEEVGAKLAAEFAALDAAVADSRAAVDAAADRTVAAVLAGLPVQGPVSRADVEAALRAVLGSVDGATPTS